MFSKTSEFSMRDQSSKPFAWMIEGLEAEDILAAGSVENFIRQYVKTAISVQNGSKSKDSTVYKAWRSGWEFDEAVAYLKAFISQ